MNKIKNYIEDYLLQLKEAEENEKLLKEEQELIRIKEQKEKELRERFILPTVNNFELIEIKENSVIIGVPLYEEKEIIDKNIYNISNCQEKYGKEKLEYVVYLFNNETMKYDKKIIEKKEENILEISELKSNTIYLFLLGVKFGNNYSNATSNKFYIIT